MLAEKNQSSSRKVVGIFHQVCLYVVALLFISGCQHLLKKEEPVTPIEPVKVKQNIAGDFSAVIDNFLKVSFLCKDGEQYKVFLKPFGTNYYDMPYLSSYLHEICYNKLKYNDYIKLVPMMKSKPRFIIESHIVKNADTQLLVNIISYKNNDIISTKTIPFIIDDIDLSEYIEHKTKIFKSKQYAFLKLNSATKTYTFADSYTVKGPRIEESYSGSGSGSGHFEGEFDANFNNSRDSKSYSGDVKGDATGRATGKGLYSKQTSYTFNMGDSAIYPIDQKCYLNGVLKEANEDNVYYEDAIEAQKKQFFTFSFVGAEWDAISQTQKRHKKYTKKYYIIPTPNETITMNVKFVYSKDKKGIFVDATNSKNQKLKLYSY